MSRLQPATEGAVEEHEAGGGRPPAASPDRIVLTHDDLLWFTTCEDQEGRLTLGLVELAGPSIGVLVDDAGTSLGLRLCRREAQDLHRALVTWLAGTTGSVA